MNGIMDRIKHYRNLFDDSVSNVLNKGKSNPYIESIIVLFLIGYIAFAVPRLPSNVAKLFDNMFVQFIFLFIIAYSAKNNPTVAIVAAIAFMATLHFLNRIKLQENMADVSAPTYQYPLDFAEMPNGVSNDARSYQSNFSQAGVGSSIDSHAEFYPQYANLKPDAYMERNTQENVASYDPASGYAKF